ncbi:hypothetical protein AGMMS49965_19330 [Bacteroidia bacterium]|nr:hypothetical protein AGMMS49965_19330 [Bacteroidia bacterium]
MKTLSIKVSDLEYSTFGFEKENLSFSELTDAVEKQITLQALKNSVDYAAKYNLSSLTASDISQEISAARK